MTGRGHQQEGETDQGRDETRTTPPKPPFEAYVRINYTPLVRYGAALVGRGDPAQAEDLVQAALARVSRTWGRIEPGRETAYVHTAMARLAWRQSRRRWHGETPGLDVGEMPMEEQGFGAVDDRDAVRRALERLPISQRVVLTLRYLDELSEQETARVLHCSVGTIKSRASRALQALRTTAGQADGGSRIDTQGATR